MKLITVNIEGDRHLSRIIPFIKHESPEVLCLQEVFEDTASKIASFGYAQSFLPMNLQRSGNSKRAMGVAVLVKHAGSAKFRSLYYHVAPGGLQLFDPLRQEDTVHRGVIFSQCMFGGTEYHVGTTHFTWTERGDYASPSQIAHMDSLITKMGREPSHILCGDFNIPRKQNPLYSDLTNFYIDSIPGHITASLDKTFHRLGSDPTKASIFESFMVDYILTLPPYVVTDVRLQFGVSDHAAVIGEVHA